MIVHLCDLSVKTLCQNGQQETGQVEAIGMREALHCDSYVQYVTEWLLLWQAVLTDQQKYFLPDDGVSLILSHMGA